MNETGSQRAPELPSNDPEIPSSQPAPLAALSGLEQPETGASTDLAPLSPPAALVVPADLRTPFGWVDLGLLGIFYAVGGVVLTLLVAGGVLLAFGISPATLQKSVTARSVVLIVSQGLLSGATLLFLFLLLRKRTSSPFWPAVGWHRFRNAVSKAAAALQYAFGGFGLALLVGFLGRFVGNDSSLPLEEMFRSRPSVLLMMALGILVAPLVEETIFRGCIYPVIARKFGLRAGVLATGILFGLAHAQQLWGGWGQIGLLIGVGILLTYVRAEAGTVAASYFVHLGYNTTLFAGFFFATSGLQHIPS